MSAAVLERPGAATIDAGIAHDPVHFAGLGRSVVATLHDYTGHAALAALDDLAFEAGELMHMAISKCDRRGSAHAAGKLQQAIALAAILVDHEKSGEWDSLGAALYLLRVAQQQFNETREGWE